MDCSFDLLFGQALLVTPVSDWESLLLAHSKARIYFGYIRLNSAIVLFNLKLCAFFLIFHYYARFLFNLFHSLTSSSNLVISLSYFCIVTRLQQIVAFHMRNARIFICLSGDIESIVFNVVFDVSLGLQSGHAGARAQAGYG